LSSFEIDEFDFFGDQNKKDNSPDEYTVTRISFLRLSAIFLRVIKIQWNNDNA